MKSTNESTKSFKNNFGFYESGKGFYMKTYFWEKRDYEFLRAYENRFRGEICIE